MRLSETKPRVSVIFPTFNRAIPVKRAIQSVYWLMFLPTHLLLTTSRSTGADYSQIRMTSNG